MSQPIGCKLYIYYCSCSHITVPNLPNNKLTKTLFTIDGSNKKKTQLKQKPNGAGPSLHIQQIHTLHRTILQHFTII